MVQHSQYIFFHFGLSITQKFNTVKTICSWSEFNNVRLHSKARYKYTSFQQVHSMIRATTLKWSFGPKFGIYLKCWYGRALQQVNVLVLNCTQYHRITKTNRFLFAKCCHPITLRKFYFRVVMIVFEMFIFVHLMDLAKLVV